MKKLTSIPFFKFSATGNDFILFDNREKIFTGQEKEFFVQICQRRISVGADGVLLIEDCPGHDFRMRYINADGSEAACGNGSRSAAYFAWQQKIVGDKMSFIVEDEVYEAEVNTNKVRLKMPGAKDLSKISGVLEESFFEEGGFVDTGVPHYVLFTENVADIEVSRLGKKYRKHKAFQPDGTNVDFVEIVSNNQIKVRTYERGVEDETLSCGTGCVASALIGNVRNKTSLPTEVITKGGTLFVYGDKRLDNLYLEGEVKLIYQGKLQDEQNNH